MTILKVKNGYVVKYELETWIFKTLDEVVDHMTLVFEGRGKLFNFNQERKE